VDGHKINFSLGAWFSCDEQKNRQEGLFFNLGCTRQGLAVVGENCLQGGEEEPVHRRKVLDGST